MNKPLQIARLYRKGVFVGLDVAVDGELVGNALSTKVICHPDECPKLVVEFAIGLNGEDELGQAIRMDLA